MNRPNRSRTESLDLEAQAAIYALQRGDFVPFIGKINYLERVQRARLDGTLSHHTRAEQDRTERFLRYCHIAMINSPVALVALGALYYYATH